VTIENKCNCTEIDAIEATLTFTTALPANPIKDGAAARMRNATKNVETIISYVNQGLCLF
jgi:hypothetical protein